MESGIQQAKPFPTDVLRLSPIPSHQTCSECPKDSNRFRTSNENTALALLPERMRIKALSERGTFYSVPQKSVIRFPFSKGINQNIILHGADEGG